MKEIILNRKKPLVCIPLVSNTLEELMEDVKEAEKMGAEILEFRSDFLNVSEKDDIFTALKEIKNITSLPLIFTFRTSFEGGEKEIETKDYIHLIKKAIETEDAEIVDCEFSRIYEFIDEIKEIAIKKGVKLIFSYHNFKETPPENEIVKKFTDMEKAGADIPKIACMANEYKDLFALMDAASSFTMGRDIPIIAISMGKIGMASRFMSENFGSVLTFASLSKESAPGQMNISNIKTFLDVIHKANKDD